MVEQLVSHHPERLRQEFEASLGNLAFCLKIKKNFKGLDTYLSVRALGSIPSTEGKKFSHSTQSKYHGLPTPRHILHTDFLAMN